MLQDREKKNQISINNSQPALLWFCFTFIDLGAPGTHSQVSARAAGEQSNTVCTACSLLDQEGYPADGLFAASHLTPPPPPSPRRPSPLTYLNARQALFFFVFFPFLLLCLFPFRTKVNQRGPDYAAVWLSCSAMFSSSGGTGNLTPTQALSCPLVESRQSGSSKRTSPYFASLSEWQN